MPELGLIDAGDVKQLGDAQLTTVCNALILFELRKAGLPSTIAELTHAITVRDGGLDALVAWVGEPKSAGTIPSPITGFQYKATPMGPADCAAELQIRDGTDLKPAVRRLFESGGTYVLISGANELNSQLTEERLTGMRQVISDHLGEGAHHIEVWDAQKIANWICTYLPAVAYVSNCVGRAYAHELRSFDEWASMKDYANAYARLPSETALFEEIVGTLSSTGRGFRIDGLPGLGKSRLSLETVKQIHGGSDCAYIDVARQTIADQLPGLVINWKRSGVAGILVVDNCPADLHERLEREIDGSKLSLLTIDYNPMRMATATPVKHLQRRDPDDIRAIIKAQYGATFGIVGLERIVARADGWPLIALRLAQGLQEHGDIVEEAPEATLMTRILGIDDSDRDSRRVIRTLSLFEHVGFEAPYGNDLEYIRETFCEPMNAALFGEIVQQFRARGILAVVGSLLRVTPPPMAVQLAAEWIQSYPHLHDRLFDPNMPPRLVEYFCKQFAHLDTVPEARDIAGKLLAAGGLIGTFDALKTRRGARVFRALSKVDPSAANACLVRTILPRTREQLLQYEDGRRDVVFALEQLVYPSDLFLDAARVLAHLAIAENEHISNNATGVLAAKFVTFGAQTEANGDQRLTFLDELIASRDNAHVVVAAKCIEVALSPDVAASHVVDPPEMGRPVREWTPNEHEAIAYRNGIFQRAKEILALDGTASGIVRHAIASAVRTLVWAGLYSDLEDLVKSANASDERPWKEGVEQLRLSLRYEAKDNTEASERIQALLDAISPRELAQRVRLTVTDPPVDFEEREGAFVDRSAERAAEFAVELVQSGHVNDVLPIIVRGNQQKGIEFGKALATAADNVNDLIQHLVDETTAVSPLEQNVGPLSGALSALAEHSRERYVHVISDLLRNESLREKVAFIVAIVRPKDSELGRLIAALRSGDIGTGQFEALGYGGSLDACSREKIEELLTALHDRGAYQIEYFIAAMQKVSHPEKWPIFAPYVKNAILRMDIVRNPLAGFHDWSVIEDTKRLLDSPGNEDLAESLALALFEVAQDVREFQPRQRLAEFVPPLFARYQNITWDLLLRTLSQIDDIRRYWLLGVLEYLAPGSTERRSALNDVPIDLLLEASRRFPDFFPQHVAGTCSLYYEDSAKHLQPTPVAEMLLQYFSHDEVVRRAFGGNLMSFASVGPRAPYYVARLGLVERLPHYGDPATQAWLAELRGEFASLAEEQAKRDTEFQQGAW